MKATIINYDPETGKGKYRTEFGEEVGFRYTQFLHLRMLPKGTRVVVKKGIICPAKTLWQQFKDLMTKELF